MVQFYLRVSVSSTGKSYLAAEGCVGDFHVPSPDSLFTLHQQNTKSLTDCLTASASRLSSTG